MPKLSIRALTGFRLTVRQLLLMIAAIGVVLGAFRYHFSLGSFVCGVLALTTLRTRQVIDGFRKRGGWVTRGHTLRRSSRRMMLFRYRLTAGNFLDERPMTDTSHGHERTLDKRVRSAKCIFNRVA